ncbi:MAG: hypothetical protein JAZ03_14240 [Candidatus Thiodiazotropha taylori]|nr:hypothetical protein [Candidatus Thiodiazotropha taylori]MCW4335090.1 hypothetical protein [Candidatus Thiodiazotropha endolucinida]
MSKDIRNDALDIKVHYQYHGSERCGLVDTTFNSLYGMDFEAFMSFLKDEIPQLNRLDTLRVCFQDEEKTYIDMTPKNYHRFLRLSTFTFQSDIPKINIKVLEGASPAIMKRKETGKPPGLSSRALNFDPDKYQVTYKSPLELEMDLKRREITEKEKETSLLTKQFEKMSREFNPNVFQDTSKNVCTKCHLRMGHTRNR